MSALGIEDEPRGPARGMPGAGGLYANRFSPRGRFATAFGYDPSERREEIQTSIPQALVLMNSPSIQAGLRTSGFGYGATALGRLLREFPDNKDLVSELYLRTLARQPSSEEFRICLAFARKAASRAEAFEDIQWSLINSTEFLHRN
jgi:hypothetical protein